MVSATPAEVRERAASIAGSLSGLPVSCELNPGSSSVGGGSLPGELLPTTILALRPKNVSTSVLEARLRQGNPPVVARLQSSSLLLDLRTVLAEETEALSRALTLALQ
jgi:L-seryl-tRNA(Ser) seleniumtransferase